MDAKDDPPPTAGFSNAREDQPPAHFSRSYFSRTRLHSVLYLGEYELCTRDSASSIREPVEGKEQLGYTLHGKLAAG